MEHITNVIKKIAKEYPEGFTIELPTLRKVTNGISAAYFATQDSFDDDALMDVINHAEKHDQMVGGWYDKENGKFYYDSIKIFDDIQDVIQFGKENRQKAIYDITNLRLIEL